MALRPLGSLELDTLFLQRHTGALRETPANRTYAVGMVWSVAMVAAREQSLALSVRTICASSECTVQRNKSAGLVLIAPMARAGQGGRSLASEFDADPIEERVHTIIEITLGFSPGRYRIK